MNILSYFPYQSFRPQQEKILKELEDYISSFNFFMLEAPTGFGKSAVAYALAKWIQGEYGSLSHICVADKFLQEQYLSSFSDLVMVKGRGNFICPYSPIGDITCDKAMCTVIERYDCPHKPRRERIETITGSMPVFDEHGVLYDWSYTDEIGATHCPYWAQKDAGIRNDITVNNYHYFLYENNFAKSFARRELGVFDECHIIENVLMGFVEKNILLNTLNAIWRERHPDERYRFKIPYLSDIDQWADWIYGVWDALLTLNVYYGELIKTDSVKQEDATKFRRYKDMIDRLKTATELLSSDPDNWVYLREDDRVTFKPVTIREFSPYLFSHVNKSLLMSATILDHEKLKRYLGIEEDVKFIRVDESTFPVENRPIYQDHRGKATAKTMEKYLPQMLDRIDNYYIPNKGENKGVIHTHTHKIAEYILRNSEHSDIMVSNTGNVNARDKVFQDFFDTDAPCVMVSPSMNLGVDLFDERCRWQVIVKIPYPYLGDPQIRKRMEIDPDWYDYQTLMSLIQCYGRGCRSTTDWCETYVTDTMFAWLISKNKDSLPKWFSEAIGKL